MVAARSAAEMPVVVSGRKSTETVKAVPKPSLFFGTMRGSPRSSSRSPVRPTQTSPLVWRTMKASASGVT